MEIDFDKLSEILYQLLMVVLIPLAGFVARWINAKYQQQRIEIDEQKRWMLDEGVKVAIYAAEQLYSAGKGAEKKAYALDIAERWLAQYKIDIDLDVLEAAIEAEVKRSFEKPVPPVGDGS